MTVQATNDNPFQARGTASANTLLNPYQRWGTDVAGLTTAEALKQTGLAGWNQRKVEPIIMDGAQEYPAGTNRFNVADIPGLGPVVLGAVTDAYEPVQIETAFTPLIDDLGAEGFKPETMGSWENGRSCFALFRSPGSVTLPSGDAIDPYFLITKRNDGEGGISGHPTAIRVKCANEIGGIMPRKARQQFIKVHHTRHADTQVMQRVEVMLGLIDGWDRGLAGLVGKMEAKKVAKSTYEKKVVPAALGKGRPEAEGRSQSIFDRQFDELMASWDSDVAADGNNAWRAWNAVSEWEQHHRSKNEGAMARAVLLREQPASRRALAALGFAG